MRLERALARLGRQWEVTVRGGPGLPWTIQIGGECVTDETLSGLAEIAGELVAEIAGDAPPGRNS